jgi:hypothetical protein
VRAHAALRAQRLADVAREAEVSDAVAVEVADLVPADAEGESPRSPGPATTPGRAATSSVIRSLAV